MINLLIGTEKIAFSIGNLTVTWYAIIILSGAIIGTVFGYFYFGKRLGLNSDLVSEGLAFGLLFGILGARLYYVAFSGYHFDSFIDLINPGKGGLAIHGALLAVAIYLPLWCKIRHVDTLTLLEIALPLIMFAQCVGRWGNFMNQEAYGPETTKEFLQHLLIPNFIIENMYINGAYHHPTFLYESVANLIGLTIYQIVRKYNKKIYVGDAIAFYLVWYGMVRFPIEILRTDALLIGSSGIKIAQVVSILMFVGGITFFVLRRIFKFRLVSCYDALYASDAWIMTNSTKIDTIGVLVFDLDGTLVDSYLLIETVVLATFKELFPDYNMTKEEAHTFFGPYIKETFLKYVNDEVDLDTCIANYQKYIELYTPTYLKSFPGIDKELARLKRQGYKITVASNKITADVKKNLELTNLDSYVDFIIGADMMEHVKPDPYCINYIKEKYDTSNVIVIGDMPNDVITAKKANANSVATLWCVSKEEDFVTNDEIDSSPNIFLYEVKDLRKLRKYFKIR